MYNIDVIVGHVLTFNVYICKRLSYVLKKLVLECSFKVNAKVTCIFRIFKEWFLYYHHFRYK